VAQATHAAADLARVRRIVNSLHVYLAPGGAYHARVVRSLRYYDDNNWVALDLLDAAQVLHDPSLLQPVKQIFAFLTTGWDAKLGGGIIWADGKLDRPTVSTAPAISIALRLAAATHDPSYRAWADRLYAWMNTALRDPNGLYYDHIDGSTGAIDRDLVSYNQGVMIQANLDYYSATGRRRICARPSRSPPPRQRPFKGRGIIPATTPPSTPSISWRSPICMPPRPTRQTWLLPAPTCSGPGRWPPPRERCATRTRCWSRRHLC